MQSDSPILLILGAGPNTGAAVSNAFAAKGYRVALAARSADHERTSATELHIPVDLSNPSAVQIVFAIVTASWGIPSVVIYNAAGNTLDTPDAEFNIPLDLFMEDLNTNVSSVYSAIQESIRGFSELPSHASKTFIMTGNAFNTSAFPPLLTLGVGKAASAHMIEYASNVYTMHGYNFYYADQRDINGSPAWIGVNGYAAGKFYLQLAESNSRGPWQQIYTIAGIFD